MKLVSNGAMNILLLFNRLCHTLGGNDYVAHYEEAKNCRTGGTLRVQWLDVGMAVVGSCLG